MVVSQLYIYPIKGLGGISLQQSQVMQRGLQFDRRYMLVDENGKFISQRTIPQLALFKLKSIDNGFEITYNNQQLILPFAISGKTTTVTIWDDTLEVILAPDEFNNWFSSVLDSSVRLVFMCDESQRPVNAKYAVNNEQVSFADGYPVLLLSEASLELLNSKLDIPAEMERFRPNIVITGAKAHQEDEFTYFSIDKVSFKVTKPCARCVVTTINPHTAVFGKEPLKTLAHYRNVNNSILFGVNLLCLTHGTIAVGMPLQLI